MTRGHKQAKLLQALQELEQAHVQLPLPELIQALATKTDYTPVTIKTYASKRFKNRILHKVEGAPQEAAGDGNGKEAPGNVYEIRGSLAYDEKRFAQLMSQNIAGTSSSDFSDIQDEGQWVETLRELVTMGRDRGYKLTKDDMAMILSLLP